MKKLAPAIAAGLCGLALCASSHARVTRIVIDETIPLAPAEGASAIAYEQVAGRAFGELDPQLPGNAIIQDIELARDADGNELGGVPVVLRDAPLGTYLGWNVTAGGEKPFHKDQICDYVGGMIPFARTAAEREAQHDPRLSLQERYGSHDGYVAAVATAASRAVAEGFLLPSDAAALVTAAQNSAVLR